MKSPGSALVASSLASTPAKAREVAPSAIADPIKKLRRSIAIELVEPYCQAGRRGKLAADELANSFQVKAYHAQVALAVRIARIGTALFYRGGDIAFEPVPRLRYPARHPGFLLGHIAAKPHRLIERP